MFISYSIVANLELFWTGWLAFQSSHWEKKSNWREENIVKMSSRTCKAGVIKRGNFPFFFFSGDQNYSFKTCLAFPFKKSSFLSVLSEQRHGSLFFWALNQTIVRWPCNLQSDVTIVWFLKKKTHKHPILLLEINKLLNAGKGFSPILI